MPNYDIPEGFEVVEEPDYDIPEGFALVPPAPPRPSFLGRAWKAAKGAVVETGELAAKLPFVVEPILPEGVKRGLLDMVDAGEAYRARIAPPPAQGFVENTAEVLGHLAPFAVGSLGAGVPLTAARATSVGLKAPSLLGKAVGVIGRGTEAALVGNPVVARMEAGHEAGEDKARTIPAALLSGATTAAMIRLKMGTRRQAISSAVAAPVMGITERYAQNQITDKQELRHDPLDKKMVLTDLAMGLGFSSLAHYITVRNSNKIVNSVAERMESGQPVSATEIWVVQQIAKGGRGQGAATRAKEMLVRVEADKAKKAIFEQDYPTVEDAPNPGRIMDPETFGYPRSGSMEQSETSSGIEDGRGLNPYGGQEVSSGFLDPYMVKAVERRLGAGLKPGELLPDEEAYLSRVETFEDFDHVRVRDAYDEAVRNGADPLLALQMAQGRVRPFDLGPEGPLESPYRPDFVMRRPELEVEYIPPGADPQPVRPRGLLPAPRLMLPEETYANGPRSDIDMDRPHPTPGIDPATTIYPGPEEYTKYDWDYKVRETPSGIVDGREVGEALATTLNKGEATNGKTSGKSTKGIPAQGDARNAQGNAAQGNVNAHEGRQKGLLKAVKPQPVPEPPVAKAAPQNAQEAPVKPAQRATSPKGTVPPAPESAKKPEGVVKTIKGTHKSSNLESLQNGFEDRIDKGYGISIARNKGEELSSPTLAEPKGSKGTVAVAVEGKGLDYKDPVHRKYIDGIWKRQDREIKAGTRTSFNMAKELKENGYDFVENWNSIGEAPELHVLNNKAIKIQGETNDVPPVRQKGSKGQAKVPDVRDPDEVALEAAKKLLASQKTVDEDAKKPTSAPALDAKTMAELEKLGSRTAPVAEPKPKAEAKPKKPSVLSQILEKEMPAEKVAEGQVFTEGKLTEPPAIPVVEKKAKGPVSTPRPIEEVVGELGVEVAENGASIYPMQRLKVKQLTDAHGGSIDRAIEALGPIKVAKELLLDKPVHADIFRIVEGVNQLEADRLGEVPEKLERAKKAPRMPQKGAISPEAIGEPAPAPAGPKSTIIIRKGAGKLKDEKGASPELASVVNAIGQTKTFKETQRLVHDLGQRVYQAGMKFKEFAAEVKAHVGEMWEKVQAHVESAWRAAKKAYKASPLGNERGSSPELAAAINAVRSGKFSKQEADTLVKELKGSKPVVDFGRVWKFLFQPERNAPQESLNAEYKRKGDIDRVINFATMRIKEIAKPLIQYTPEQSLRMIMNWRDGHTDKLVGKERELFDVFNALGKDVWDKVVQLDPEMEAYRKDNHALLTLQFILDGEAPHKEGLWSGRSLEGAKNFLKKRGDKTVEELLASGKVLKSTNVVEILMHTLTNELKYVHTGVLLKEGIASNRIKYLPDGMKLPEDHDFIPDRVADVFKKLLYKESVKGTEFVDEGVIKGLMQVAADLGISPERVANVAQRLRDKGIPASDGVLGYAVKGTGETVTQNNTPLGVLAHEIGHQIDYKYDLWNKIVQEAEGFGATGQTKTESRKMRGLIRKELGKIADLTGRAHDYSHSKPEQIAQMVEIYIQAPELMKEDAPHVYKAFDRYVREEFSGSLKGLAEIRQGIKYGKLNYELPVPPPRFTKAFVVRDAAGKPVEYFPYRDMAEEFAIRHGFVKKTATGEIRHRRGTTDPIPNVTAWMETPKVEHAGKWIMPKDEARMLRNSLSEDKVRGNFYTNALMEIKNRWTAIELVSGFHYATIAQEVISSRAGLGLQQFLRAVYGSGRDLYRGQPPNADTKAEWEALKRTLDPKNWGSSLWLGEMAKAYELDPKGFMANPQNKAKMQQWFGSDAPIMEELVQIYFRSGGQLHQDHNLKWGKIFLTGPEKIKAGMKTKDKQALLFGALQTPTVDIYHKYVQEMLFERFVPTAKFSDFALQYTYDLKQYAHMIERGLITKEQLAQRNLKSAENRFGEMNWENFWLNRTYKSALQLMFRSFSWQYGTWRGFGTAVGRIPSQWKMAADAIRHGEIPPVDRDIAWVVTLLGTHIAEAVLIGYTAAAITGDKELRPKEWLDYIYPKIGLLMRIGIPGYVKEPISLVRDAEDSRFWIPTKFVTSKLSGFIGKLAELWRNKNYYGDKIYDEDGDPAERTAAIVAHMFPKPFSLESWLRERQRGGGVGAGLMSLMGFNAAPGWVDKSPALNLAQKYNAGNVVQQGRKKDEAEDRYLKRQVLAHFRGGGTADTLDPKLKEGVIKLGPDRVQRLVKEIRLTPIQYAFENLKDITEAAKVWGKMSDQEKRETGQMMGQKIMAYYKREQGRPERIAKKKEQLGLDAIINEITHLGDRSNVSSEEDVEEITKEEQQPVAQLPAPEMVEDDDDEDELGG